MKKIKLIIIFIVLLFPLNVYGLNVDPELTCDSNILEDNKESICTYKLNITDGNISALSSKYTFESDYVVVKIEKEGSWQGDSNLNRIDYYDSKDYTNEVLIAKVIVKKKDGLKLKNDVETKIGFNLVEVGESSGKANKYNILTQHTFKIKKEVITTKPTTTKTTTSKTTTKTTTSKTTTKTTTSKTTTKTTTSKTTKSTKEETKTNSSTTTTTTIKEETKASSSTTTTNKPVFNNPSTLDDIVIYISIFSLSIITILIIIFYIKKKKEQDL